MRFFHFVFYFNFWLGFGLVMTRSAVTYYDLLGLSPRATDADVRRAYHALALRWHPDRNPQNRALATHYTALLNTAYAHLRTAPQRRAYDRHLAARRAPALRPSAPRRAENRFLNFMRAVFWPFAPVMQENRHGG